MAKAERKTPKPWYLFRRLILYKRHCSAYSFSYLIAVKAATSTTECTLWRNESLPGIDFAAYTLSHHSFTRHFHDHYVIEFVLKGADQFYCNGHTYTAVENQLVLINPGEVHTGSTVSDTTLQYFSLYPDHKTLQEVAETIDIHLPGHFNFQHTLFSHPALIRKFSLLFNSFQSQAEPLQQQELFYACLHELLQQQDQPAAAIADTGKKDPRILLLIDFIRVNFKEQISLQQMAQLVCLNPFHLVRFFKKSTGLSPYEYLLVLRNEYARQLLRSGYKVQEAAKKAGFYDASHFNRLFCKTNGATPKSFRPSKRQYCTILNG